MYLSFNIIDHFPILTDIIQYDGSVVWHLHVTKVPGILCFGLFYTVMDWFPNNTLFTIIYLKKSILNINYILYAMKLKLSKYLLFYPVLRTFNLFIFSTLDKMLTFKRVIIYLCLLALVIRNLFCTLCKLISHSSADPF